MTTYTQYGSSFEGFNSKRQSLDVSDVWIKDLKEKVVEIPRDIDELRTFLQSELRMKIPFSHEFIQLISVLDTQHLCDEVCEKLFAPSLSMYRKATSMVNQVVDPVMPWLKYATKKSYHYFWDTLIATVLQTSHLDATYAIQTTVLRLSFVVLIFAFITTCRMYVYFEVKSEHMVT
jgi:hypothetical protein